MLLEWQWISRIEFAEVDVVYRFWTFAFECSRLGAIRVAVRFVRHDFCFAAYFVFHTVNKFVYIGDAVTITFVNYVINAVIFKGIFKVPNFDVSFHKQM